MSIRASSLNLKIQSMAFSPLRSFRHWYQRCRYDRYWRSQPSTWSYGITIIDQALSTGNFTSVLDAGCGRGDVVQALNSRGIPTVGVDIAGAALPEGPEFVCCTLDRLPFSDQSFALTFCSEVLEHIPSGDIPGCLRELARVTRDRLFLTISLRPSSNHNAYHITLRPRTWWEDQMAAMPEWRKNTLLVDRFQRRGPFTNREVLEKGPTKAIMGELNWFLSSEPYSLEGELEPWYFVYDRVR